MWLLNISIQLFNGYFKLDYSNFFTLSPNTHMRGPSFKLLKYVSHLPIIHVTLTF